jgi:DNA-binding MarR family transcriptional regulator
MALSTDTRSLTSLDDALFDIQRIVRRPGYRARLLAALRIRVELSTVRVLRAVERFGDQAPCIGDIADQLLIDPSTASRFVEHQVDARYLERRRDPSDGRRSQLLLTDSGRALLDEVTDARRQILAEVTADWAPSDLDRLSELLVHLRADFDHLESAE